MYIFENKNYTEEDLEKIADVKGYTFDELLKKNPSIKKTDPDPDDEGKKNPSQETLDATVKVDDTASKLEDTSSELQELDNSPEAIFKRRKQSALEQAQILSRPIELEEVTVTYDPSDKTPEDLIENINNIDDRIELISGKDMQVDPLDSPKRINNILKEKLKEEGTVKSLVRMVKKGDKGLGEFLLSTPSFAYEVASLVSDPINRALGLPETDLTKFEEAIGTRSLLDSLIEEQEKLGKVQEAYKDLNNIEGGAFENFRKGNWNDGFYLLGETLAESAPVSLSLMFGGAAGLSRTALTLGGGIPLAAGEMRTQRQEFPEQQKSEMLLKSALIGLSEGFFEGVLGSGAIGKTYKNIIAKEGVKKGTETFKRGIISMYEGALQKFGVPVSVVGEGLEEVGTQITQNLVNGKPFSEGVADAFLAGLGGGGLYGAPINLAKGVDLGKSLIQQVKINKAIKPTEYTNISYAFNPAEKTSELQIKLSQLSKSSKILDDSVNKEIKKGNITKEEGDAIRLNFRSTQQASNQIKPLKFNINQQAEVIDLLKEKNQLNIEIKQIADKALSVPQQERVDEINERLKGINVERAAETIIEATDASKVIIVENDKELQDKHNIKGANYSAAGGFFQDGKIYINKEIAGTLGTVTEGAHELLHPIAKEAIKNNPKIIEEFKNLLPEDIKELVDARINDPQNKDIYTDEYLAANPDEFLTQFSDLVLEGQIKFNENIFTKIGDFIIPILRKLGFKKIKFNSGQDVYKFMREYTRNIKEGKISEGIKEVIPTELKTEDTAFSLKGKEASERVQKLYEQKGPDGAAFEIIQEFKPITTAIARKRKNAPNYNEEELVSEIETGEGGIFDLIRSYKKDSGIPLAAYINSLLPKRVIAASKRILGEEFTADIADVQIAETQAAEPEVIETAVQEELPKIKVAERIFTPEEQTKLKEKVSQELPNITEEQLTFKTLPNLTAEVIAEKLNMPVKKLTGAANFTQAEFGRAQQFIKDNIKTVKLALPQAAVLEGEAVSEELIGTATNVPNKLLKNPKLYTRLERTTKKAGLVPYQKNKNIQDVDILEAVGIVEDKLTKGPRDPEAQTAKGVLNILGRTAANQEVREQGAQTEKISKSQQLDTRAGIGDDILFSAKGKKVSNKIVDKAFRDPKEVKKARGALIDAVKLLGIDNTIQYIIPTARRSGAKAFKKIGNEEKIVEDGIVSTRYFLVKNQNDFVNNILKEAFPNDDIKLTKRNQAISVNGKEIITPKFTNIGQSPKGFTDGTFENNIQERVNFALEQRAGMKKIVEALTSLYNNNVIDENQLFMILQTFNSSVEALIRTAAVPKFYFKGTGKNDSDYRYEHTQTASDTLVEIFRSIVKPNTGYTFDQIMDAFDVAIIPKVYDDIINNNIPELCKRKCSSSRRFNQRHIEIYYENKLVTTTNENPIYKKVYNGKLSRKS